uniref:Uncharacterized protein n=2 Tax=Geladintestivirus 1 TaxID=3233133 RepID=A0AAU8MLH6_9CAUD
MNNLIAQMAKPNKKELDVENNSQTDDFKLSGLENLNSTPITPIGHHEGSNDVDSYISKS